jgi:hypothetical protein
MREISCAAEPTATRLASMDDFGAGAVDRAVHYNDGVESSARYVFAVDVRVDGCLRTFARDSQSLSQAERAIAFYGYS